MYKMGKCSNGSVSSFPRIRHSPPIEKIRIHLHHNGLTSRRIMEFTFQDVSVSIGGTRILCDVSGDVKPGELLAIMGPSGILCDVSGDVKPGELLAIMEPSGAGKTTLLNTLAGRNSYTGEIILGDRPLDKTSKRKICYVLQQEFFFGNLTLRETLEFTAMIRLPDIMTSQEKIARMERVVEDLDLHTCLNTIMGDMFTPGLSGGQKKRANIACELLYDPQVIFLDEPTTGLDSSTASSLIQLLKNYATNSNKTIIASIHQPSSKIFFQFDKLLLLTDGQVAYFGPTVNVVDHFEAAGITMRKNFNPADFILEVLGSDDEVKERLINAAVQKRDKEPVQSFTRSVSKETKPGSKLLSTWSRLSSRLLKRKPVQDHQQEVEDSDLDAGSVHMSLLDLDIDDNLGFTVGKWPTGFFTQYTQLTIRTFKESRKRILNLSKVVENLLICAFVCLMFFQLPRSEDTLRDRMGAVFFIAAHWGFIPLFDAVTSFPMERMVINKERSAGWYRLSAYYCAKMTSELLLILVQPTMFVIIAYWVIGLNGISAFFATLGTVFIDAIAGQSFGLFIGIACLQINQAMTVSITFQMGIMLLGGLFTRNIPIWLDWLKYLSFLHYSFHSLMVLEFTNAPPVSCLTPSNSSAFIVCSDTNSTQIQSSEILEYYDIQPSYWLYMLPLLLFTAIFRILGYLTLRYIRTPF